MTAKAVAKKINKKSALIEFVKIRDLDLDKRKWGSSRYLAFVLLADGKVSLVDLGSAHALEKEARRVLDGIRAWGGDAGKESNDQIILALKDLHKIVWKPLVKELKGADKLLISPDGMLNLVPFAALVQDDGTYLIENHGVAYVTSGRELIGAEGNAIQPQSELLLAANPDYDGEIMNCIANGVGAVVSYVSPFRPHVSPGRPE